MMKEYGGILGALAEAADIQSDLGVPADEAFRIQRERADLRMAELQAIEESNVIPFRAKH